MEDVNIFKKIDIPANKITNKLIQDVLVKAQKSSKGRKQNQEHWSKVAEILWSHLNLGLNNLDDQLLCSTCFFTVLRLTGNVDVYFDKAQKIIDTVLISNQKDGRDESQTLQAVSIIYGMFQSSFITQTEKDNTKIRNILKATFDLLVLMAYEYSQYTFIVFKIINTFKKVYGTVFEEVIFNKNNQIIMLNLVNHNWENPINGVRDLNKGIFRTILCIMDDKMKESVTEELNSFYWNKAKYLMLSEIIEQHENGIVEIMHNNDWINGLMQSLMNQVLVAAGTDMYFAILKKLKTEYDWSKLFFDKVIELLRGNETRAIENFSNYWCMATFKKFPILFKMILNELNVNNQLNNIFLSLCMTKQGNKLGLIGKNWESNDHNHIKLLILTGLDYIDTKIRILAFDILCVSRDIPTKFEYELVLSYIFYNINTDCTVLRQNMLKSFTSFLIRIQTLFVNNKNKTMKSDINNMLEFCKSVQEMIINSLNTDGNYQRKITSVKICKIFLNCLSDVSKKKLKSMKTTMTKFLKDEDHWILADECFVAKLISLLKDPADDVRENIVHLLLDHYSLEKNTYVLNQLIKDAQDCLGSKFFYQISCAQSMFKLIIHILAKENNYCEIIFASVDDIFTFSYNELVAECKLNRNIVDSIEKGKQLYSFLYIIQTVFEVCFQTSYKIKVSQEDILELLKHLQDISNQFAWEHNVFSSDFAKMSDVIQTIIYQSGYNICNGTDEAKISGLHQIVLNCLWLNVKASCDLSCLIIRYYCTEDQNFDICVKSLQIITNVLETSRHKGAIEAAGSALGQSIMHLSSLSAESRIATLPLVLLKCKLNDLLYEADKMTSVTRRGAGLSIMIHKIVCSDLSRGKPLFHYAMNILLEICCNSEDCPRKFCDDDINNENDLPKATYIHFLTKIVADSNVSAYIKIEKVAEIAFENLTSPYWQIRNAALQLYGALVPKLFGQKKGFCATEETVATVAFDEFRTHSPKLWKFIINQLGMENVQLRVKTVKDKVNLHSNLVPILNMLANGAKRYNFSYDNLQQHNVDLYLFQSLMELLESPIYAVRRLTAKCIYNIFSSDQIYDGILSRNYLTENYLHGCLMLIRLLHCHQPNEHAQLNKLREKFQPINNNKHSYICKEIFDEIFDNGDAKENNLVKVFTEVDNNIKTPGIFAWVNTKVQKYLQNSSSWDKIQGIIPFFFKRDDVETYLEKVSVIIESNSSIPEEVAVNILQLLLSFEHKLQSAIIWKILYQISAHIEQCISKIDIADIIKYLKENPVSYRLRYMIPFTSKVNNNENDWLLLATIIYNLSKPEITVDADMRIIAAMSINGLADKFEEIPDAIKIIVIKSVIILLQDEDEDVRNISALFYSKITKTKKIFQPNICLHRILDYKLLQILFNDYNTNIKILCQEVTDMLRNLEDRKAEEYNPFANNTKNIYLEISVYKDLINKLILFTFQ